MPTNVYFVRHAHSTYTQEEFKRPLSEQGFKDAKRVYEILDSKNINQVISSPYLRAHQTVEKIANSIGRDVIHIDSFKERKLTEGSAKDFKLALKKVWEDYTFSWEGGESNYEAQKRGVQALKKVLNEYKGLNIVIGSHGNMMVLVMNYFDAKFNYDFWKQLTMPDIYQLTFEGEELVKINRLWNK